MISVPRLDSETSIEATFPYYHYSPTVCQRSSFRAVSFSLDMLAKAYAVYTYFMPVSASFYGLADRT